MAKQAIQTDLLGTRVHIGDVTGTARGPNTDQANKYGKIRSVYQDTDGFPGYSVQVISGRAYGQLVELYACHFRILP